MLDALGFGANTHVHHVANSSIKGDAVIEFTSRSPLEGDERPTVAVPDNASIPHTIDPEVHEHRLREHRLQLFDLPPYSLDFNLIEIVWQLATYHWRNFVTWTKETIDEEVRNLHDAYGMKTKISFA